MPYGDYHGPDKPDKGQENGSCNRKSCQAAPACCFNHGSNSWYCYDCALEITQDIFNIGVWLQTKKPHAMFETRRTMDQRLK